MTASWGEVRGRGIEQNGKRTHGHGQQCGDFGGARGDAGIRGLKSNGN